MAMSLVIEKFQKEVAPQTLCGVREGAAADIAACPWTDFDLDNSLHLRGGRRASNIVLNCSINRLFHDCPQGQQARSNEERLEKETCFSALWCQDVVEAAAIEPANLIYWLIHNS